jgi:hypothetical protein
MQQPTHTKTAISIVRDHIEDWRRENRWSRETAADMIVQAHIRIGGPRLTGIEFDPPTRDTFERMRVNADRVWRWLDDSSKDKNLLPLNFLWSVIAALPPNRRLHLVDALLAPVGLVSHELIGIEPGAPEGDRSVVMHFSAVVEHSAAANVAMSKMVDGIDPGEPEAAAKKLSIAAATIQRARGFVARVLHRRAKQC